MDPEQQKQLEQIRERAKEIVTGTVWAEVYHQDVTLLLSLIDSHAVQRLFPIQNGPSIPWDMAEIAYATYSKMHGTGQSLKRLAERGGFGWSEFLHLYFNDGKFKQTDA